jgi:hypothetical protein
MSDESLPAAHRGEHRWPMAAAALATGVLHQMLPADFRVGPPLLYPAFIVVFLVVLVAGDPGLINRERRWLRVTTGLMVAFITVVNCVSAGRLLVAIFTGDSFETAGQLLATGGIVWTTNVILFGLWYWDLDGGGAATRAQRGASADPAFVFPEMTLGDLAPRGWYPQYLDYLAFSFNTATAFSPTDVSAIKRWAKLLMIAEAFISLAVATLVIARAINIL